LLADAYGRELSDEHDDDNVYEPADDVSLEYDSVDDSDLPALAVAPEDDEMSEDDNQDENMGEYKEHNIVVTDMDSIDSSNFVDDREAVDGQNAGVDFDEENFDDDREAVDGQNAGALVDTMNE
jgi:hypothetical protein